MPVRQVRPCTSGISLWLLEHQSGAGVLNAFWWLYRAQVSGAVAHSLCETKKPVPPRATQTRSECDIHGQNVTVRRPCRRQIPMAARSDEDDAV